MKNDILSKLVRDSEGKKEKPKGSMIILGLAEEDEDAQPSESTEEEGREIDEESIEAILDKIDKCFAKLREKLDKEDEELASKLEE